MAEHQPQPNGGTYGTGRVPLPENGREGMEEIGKGQFVQYAFYKLDPAWRLLPAAQAAGYAGSARNFRRLVAAQKQAWRGEHHRGRRPAVWSPGEHLVIDWGSRGRPARVLRGAGVVAVPVPVQLGCCPAAASAPGELAGAVRAVGDRTGAGAVAAWDLVALAWAV